MTPEEEKQAEEAKGFIRAHKAFLKQKFAAISTHAKSKHPVSIFMAGSPGAGKTEFSKRLVELVIGEDGSLPVRIDADEIREIIPGYNGSNSNIFQGASARGVEILYDHVLDTDQNVILDGTFALKEKALSNIERSLKHDRLIEIYYIYQDLFHAWDFTKKREAIEHRKVSKEVFINAFLAAYKNIIAAKQGFGTKIKLNIVIKDIRDPSNYTLALNVDSVDAILQWKYDYNKLNDELI